MKYSKKLARFLVHVRVGAGGGPEARRIKIEIKLLAGSHLCGLNLFVQKIFTVRLFAMALVKRPLLGDRLWGTLHGMI